MKKFLQLFALLIPALALGQTTVQKVGGGNNHLSNGSIIVPTGASITADGSGSIIATGGSASSVPYTGVTNVPTSTLLGRTTAGVGPAQSITVGSGLSFSALTLDLPNTISASSVGSSTAIPVLTYDAKGRLTAATTAAVIAPAGTLTGTTLAANVVNASLGTITAPASTTLLLSVTDANFINLASPSNDAFININSGARAYGLDIPYRAVFNIRNSADRTDYIHLFRYDDAGGGNGQPPVLRIGLDGAIQTAGSIKVAGNLTTPFPSSGTTYIGMVTVKTDFNNDPSHPGSALGLQVGDSGLALIRGFNENSQLTFSVASTGALTTSSTVTFSALTTGLLQTNVSGVVSSTLTPSGLTSMGVGIINSASGADLVLNPGTNKTVQVAGGSANNYPTDPVISTIGSMAIRGPANGGDILQLHSFGNVNGGNPSVRFESDGGLVSNAWAIFSGSNNPGVSYPTSPISTVASMLAIQPDIGSGAGVIIVTSGVDALRTYNLGGTQKVTIDAAGDIVTTSTTAASGSTIGSIVTAGDINVAGTVKGAVARFSSGIGVGGNSNSNADSSFGGSITTTLAGVGFIQSANATEVGATFSNTGTGGLNYSFYSTGAGSGFGNGHWLLRNVTNSSTRIDVTATTITLAGTPTLSALTSNGVVTTSGGTGALGVTATSGSGSVALVGSPTFTGTVGTAALTATGQIKVTGDVTRQFLADLASTEVGFSARNTGTGGKQWSIWSIANSSSFGANGSLVWRNETDSVTGMLLTSAGALTVTSNLIANNITANGTLSVSSTATLQGQLTVQAQILATSTTLTSIFGAGTNREPLQITSASTSDTITHFTNTSTGGLDWQLRSTGQLGSGGAVAGDLSFFSPTLNAYAFKISGAAGNIAAAGTLKTAAGVAYDFGADVTGVTTTFVTNEYLTVIVNGSTKKIALVTSVP